MKALGRSSPRYLIGFFWLGPGAVLCVTRPYRALSKSASHLAIVQALTRDSAVEVRVWRSGGWALPVHDLWFSLHLLASLAATPAASLPHAVSLAEIHWRVTFRPNWWCKPTMVSEVRLTEMTPADKVIFLISPPHLHLNPSNITEISLGHLIASWQPSVSPRRRYNA